jgi:glycosyltransferase involved in cell wall biosynthesis
VRGGLIVKAVRDTDMFIAAFAEAMEAILDDRLRRELGKNAYELGLQYDMGSLVDSYGSLYSNILNAPMPEVPALAA